MPSIKFLTEGPVAKIIINRPDALNALNSDIIETLGEIIEIISLNKDIQTINKVFNIR